MKKRSAYDLSREHSIMDLTNMETMRLNLGMRIDQDKTLLMHENFPLLMHFPINHVVLMITCLFAAHISNLQ